MLNALTVTTLLASCETEKDLPAWAAVLIIIVFCVFILALIHMVSRLDR